ncbi:hypothetical protein FRC09_000766 [Ceratobasidium sp. 395]|nr:hypothetical protein FRC09_000766 [Ceratobasidium sp. 395]
MNTSRLQRDGLDANSPPGIPTVADSNINQHQVIDQFSQILACASRVTVVCGAGISTHAGVPDFRSENGLLSRKFGKQNQLQGSDLFESRTIRCRETRVPYSQALAEMRQLSRTVHATSCHDLISWLFDHGRLLRCYTQNIDGLQTRDRQDMEDVVFELHGTNIHLRCHICHLRPAEPASDFDDQILSEGYAYCPRCSANPARKRGNDRNLRPPEPGELLPDIVLNDQVTEPSKNGKTIDKLASLDAKCHILLVVGTRLKPQGVRRLVQGMADQVHASGGVVVFVDWTPLASSSWARYIDLHIQMDIEKWAKGCLNALQKVGRVRTSSSRKHDINCTRKAYKPKSKAWITAQVSNIVGRARLLRASPSYRVVDVESLEYQDDDHISTPTERVPKRVRLVTDSRQYSPAKTLEKTTPVVLVIYHNIWALSDARALEKMITEECTRRGRECYCHVLTVASEEVAIDPPTQWQAYDLIVVHLSWYTQFLHSGQILECEGEILQLLARSSELVSKLAQGAAWSAAIMICQESELLSQSSVSTLASRVKNSACAFDTVVASVDLRRFRLSGWTSFTLDVLEGGSMRRSDGEAGVLNCVTHAWMWNQDLYDHSNLVVFGKQMKPRILRAVSFDAKPLGKMLPDIEFFCACIQSQSKTRPKAWVVRHDARDKRDVRDLRITATCSSCSETEARWLIRVSTRRGAVRRTARRLAIAHNQGVRWGRRDIRAARPINESYEVVWEYMSRPPPLDVRQYQSAAAQCDEQHDVWRQRATKSSDVVIGLFAHCGRPTNGYGEPRADEVDGTFELGLGRLSRPSGSPNRSPTRALARGDRTRRAARCLATARNKNIRCGHRTGSRISIDRRTVRRAEDGEAVPSPGVGATARSGRGRAIGEGPALLASPLNL